jgi:hypothetical protein
LESGNDFLSIYDGNSTAARLIGTYSGTLHQSFISTATDGSLTFVFSSNSDINNEGWYATVSCYNPPACNYNNIVNGATLANPETGCSGEVINLSLSAPNIATGITYQWQDSSAAHTWQDILGATGSTYVYNSLTPGTYAFRCAFNCSGSELDAKYSTSKRVVIISSPSNPSSSTGGTRCGTGTVNLSATGSNLYWFSEATSGAILGTGSSFTTPIINSTTPYYVASFAAATTENTGKSSTSSTSDIINNNWGIQLDVNKNLILNSAIVYPKGSGTAIFALQNSVGTEMAVSNEISLSGTGSTPVTVNLNFSIPPGSGYRLVVKSYTGTLTLIRDLSGITYPINSANNTLNVTAGWLGSLPSSTMYNFFYNLNVTTGCESDRVAVTATVNAPPTLTVTDTLQICPGGTASLTASASPAYTSYIWTPGNLSGASQNVTPAITTSYIVTASNSSTGCVNTDTTLVIVNAQPSTMTVIPSTGSICASPAITPLTVVSGATLPDGSPANITWSAITNLYRDSAATIPYTGTPTPTVYLLPPTSGTYNYTVTATSAQGCTSTATVSLTATDNTTTVSIANSTGTVCEGQPVSITASP